MATTTTATTSATEEANPIQISIGEYDATTMPPTVPVTYIHLGVPFPRLVNACHDATGAYDAAATAERIEAVGNGVKYKIEIGAITNPRPASDGKENPEASAEQPQDDTDQTPAT